MDIKLIKTIRSPDCKKALKEANDDLDKAPDDNNHCYRCHLILKIKTLICEKILNNYELGLSTEDKKKFGVQSSFYYQLQYQ